MIRELRPSDLPRLQEFGFNWALGADFLIGIVATDEHDRAVMVAGAWQRAEVHLGLDKDFGTPGLRLALLSQVHRAMEKELKLRDVGKVVTWLDGMKAFGRRLVGLGWQKSDTESWQRRVD